MTAYHDDEWGVPVHDDRVLFEFLILEGAQAGLSWATILHRREKYRRAYRDFDPAKIAKFGARDVARLLADDGIIRNRAKVSWSIANAKAFLAVQREFGSFDAYVWSFVKGKPVVHRLRAGEALPAQTELSDLVSKDLRKRGFGFVGSTIVYSYLQAVGVVDDHAATCFKARRTRRAAPRAEGEGDGMMLLQGDAVVLAGATGRVGGSTLATFLREGARVIVLSRSFERAQQTIDALLDDDEAPGAIPFAADLTDPAQAAAAVDACVERFGRVDACVSLAGDATVAPLVKTTVEDLRSNLRGFLETAYNLSIPALRAMLAQPYRDGARSRGRIVVVTAGSSKQPAPGHGLFGAAKAGVNVLMQAIAREHKADGIVANALVLGGVATEAARRYLNAEDLAAAATPQEVADALAFLASDRGSGVNGALVDLNAREVD